MSEWGQLSPLFFPSQRASEVWPLFHSLSNGDFTMPALYYDSRYRPIYFIVDDYGTLQQQHSNPWVQFHWLTK